MLAAPALGDTYAACAGGGATLNGAPIRAASTTDLRQAIVEIGWNRHRPDAEFFSLLSRAHAGGATLRLGGSGALGLAETASGRIDAYAELHIQLWDCAAAIVICREAGAFVSPFMDGDGPVHGGSILAAAPGIAGVLGKIAGF